MIALAAALLLATVSYAAVAQTQDNGPAEDLQAFANGIIVALDGAPEPRSDQPSAVRRVLAQGVDLDAIAGFVLGDHETGASPAQLDRYRSVYNRYLLNMLSNLLLDKHAKNLKVIGSHPQDNGTSVLSEVELASGEILEWRWLLHRDGPSHRVIDLQTHGVSLAAMLRYEADSVIRRMGFNKFLDELQGKL